MEREYILLAGEMKMEEIFREGKYFFPEEKENIWLAKEKKNRDGKGGKYLEKENV